MSTPNVATSNTNIQENDSISKFKPLINEIRNKLQDVLTSASEAFASSSQHTANGDDSIQKFNKAMEEFLCLCDEAELHLRVAMQCCSQHKQFEPMMTQVAAQTSLHASTGQPTHRNDMIAVTNAALFMHKWTEEVKNLFRDITNRRAAAAAVHGPTQLTRQSVSIQQQLPVNTSSNQFSNVSTVAQLQHQQQINYKFQMENSPGVYATMPQTTGFVTSSGAGGHNQASTMYSASKGGGDMNTGASTPVFMHGGHMTQAQHGLMSPISQQAPIITPQGHQTFQIQGPNVYPTQNSQFPNRHLGYSRNQQQW